MNLKLNGGIHWNIPTDLKTSFTAQDYINESCDADFIMNNNKIVLDKSDNTYCFKTDSTYLKLSKDLAILQNPNTMQAQVKYKQTIHNLPKIKTVLELQNLIKKLTTKQGKIENNKYYQISLLFNKLIESDEVFAYPTTYGIGIYYLTNTNFEKHASSIKSKLRELGIKFENEFSDKKWIFRFKISKESENLKKIILF